MSADPATLTLGEPQSLHQADTVAPVSYPPRRATGSRQRLTAAFRDSGIAAEDTAAYARTKAWYRSSSGRWTRGLS